MTLQPIVVLIDADLRHTIDRHVAEWIGRRLISPDCPQPVRVESAVGVGQPAPTAAGGQP